LGRRLRLPRWPPDLGPAPLGPALACPSDAGYALSIWCRLVVYSWFLPPLQEASEFVVVVLVSSRSVPSLVTTGPVHPVMVVMPVSSVCATVDPVPSPRTPIVVGSEPTLCAPTPQFPSSVVSPRSPSSFCS
jgi:hypothetical protein